jgi:hypothetical protein
MLNMRGRMKSKYESLRQVLAERVVYDDSNMRVWMAPDGSGQGLLYCAKQAQVTRLVTFRQLLLAVRHRSTATETQMMRLNHLIGRKIMFETKD